MNGTGVQAIGLRSQTGGFTLRVPLILWCLALAVALAFPSTLPTTVSPTSSSLPATAKVDPSLLTASRRSPYAMERVIVRETMPPSDGAERLVRSLGGRVTHELPIISSFSAVLPAGRLAALAQSGAVARVSADGAVHMSTDTTLLNSTTPPNKNWEDAMGLPSVWNQGFTGRGVTVAVLDTGVSQVPDLGSRVAARVDFTKDQDGLDHFGHGTHMAGIIAGDGTSAGDLWSGVAPQARIVSVKVAGADGSTDVSVVIAGLQWVVAHASQYDIRVLNLSFGTDSTQSYLVDPLDFAVEQVWQAGIVVVVAAGNRGPALGTVNKPADDPFVISVGAIDTENTVTRDDDKVASFSSRGPTQDGLSKPGISAPGVTIVSNRAVGSTIDQAFPSARLGNDYFKGTGTSQAAAIVSGLAALMLQANPSLSPDQLKAVMRGTQSTTPFMVDADNATYWAQKPNKYGRANVNVVPSNGLGSIEASRGSLHVYADLPQDGMGAADADGQLDLVSGEIDAMGQPWNATGWGATGWSATGWSGTGWASVAWSATGWSSTGWNATGWSGTSWSATGWNSTGWSSSAWSGTGWCSTGWSVPQSVEVSDAATDAVSDPHTNGKNWS
jgi:serine protease AprX